MSFSDFDGFSNLVRLLAETRVEIEKQLVEREHMQVRLLTET